MPRGLALETAVRRGQDERRQLTASDRLVEGGDDPQEKLLVLGGAMQKDGQRILPGGSKPGGRYTYRSRFSPSAADQMRPVGPMIVGEIEDLAVQLAVDVPEPSVQAGRPSGATGPAVAARMTIVQTSCLIGASIRQLRLRGTRPSVHFPEVIRPKASCPAFLNWMEHNIRCRRLPDRQEKRPGAILSVLTIIRLAP